MENPSTPYTAAERMICKLRDVYSCDIQVGSSGAITAVHVTARAGRSPKQIARDIEAILAAEERVQIDHRKISIAQYGDADAPTAPALERLSITGVSLHQGTHGFEAEVTLSSGETQATGRAMGPNTRYETNRIVGAATLDAIAKLVSGDPALSLGELEETELGSRRVLLVCVNHLSGRTETSLIGSAEIGYDPTRAVICVILDAVNRVLGSFSPREPVEYEIGPAPAE
jgi:hypothetical protein